MSAGFLLFFNFLPPSLWLFDINHCFEGLRVFHSFDCFESNGFPRCSTLINSFVLIVCEFVFSFHFSCIESLYFFKNFHLSITFQISRISSVEASVVGSTVSHIFQERNTLVFSINFPLIPSSTAKKKALGRRTGRYNQERDPIKFPFSFSGTEP